MTGGRVVIPKRRGRGNTSPMSTSGTIPSRSVSELAVTTQMRAAAAKVAARYAGADPELFSKLGLEVSA